MKQLLAYISSALASSIFCIYSHAQIVDPQVHFQQKSEEIETLIKWECDLNGDGHKEVFISLQSEYAEDGAKQQTPGWFVYFSNATGTEFIESTGTADDEAQLEPNDEIIGMGAPTIDPQLCFVGQVEEINGKGIVAQESYKGRDGEVVATIYVYSIKGDHLRRTILAEYDPEDGLPAVYTKYLAEDKRTAITVETIPPEEGG